jgi:hypothetical protein
MLTYCSNGKVDKGKLQQLAFDSLQLDSDCNTWEVSSVKTGAITSPSTPSETKAPPPAYILDCQSTKCLALTRFSSAVSDISKEEVSWTGYEDDVSEKIQQRYITYLRHRVFTLYRRLFGLVFATNMVIFIRLLVTGADAEQIGGIVLVNVFCAILMRQDYVINAFFNTCCAVPSS